jgi:hypothetical protein
MVVGRMDVIVEELEQFIGFSLLEFRKSSDETVVHIEGFEPSNGVGTHCWVMSIYGSTVGRSSPEVKDCVVCNSLVKSVDYLINM